LEKGGKIIDTPEELCYEHSTEINRYSFWRKKFHFAKKAFLGNQGQTLAKDPSGLYSKCTPLLMPPLRFVAEIFRGD
jgi:hypothetical protein